MCSLSYYSHHFRSPVSLSWRTAFLAISLVLAHLSVQAFTSILLVFLWPSYQSDRPLQSLLCQSHGFPISFTSKFLDNAWGFPPFLSLLWLSSTYSLLPSQSLSFMELIKVMLISVFLLSYLVSLTAKSIVHSILISRHSHGCRQHGCDHVTYSIHLHYRQAYHLLYLVSLQLCSPIPCVLSALRCHFTITITIHTSARLIAPKSALRIALTGFPSLISFITVSVVIPCHNCHYPHTYYPCHCFHTDSYITCTALLLTTLSITQASIVTCVNCTTYGILVTRFYCFLTAGSQLGQLSNC